MEGNSTILGRNVSTQGMNVRVGSRVRRQTLCDITNTVISTASNNNNTTENNNAVCAAGPLNYVEIMKQYNQLLKILAEKNKIVELSAFEIQKFKIELQRAKQQNGQLAQSHSQMLAELNLGRDRLKNLQHEMKSSTIVVQQQKKEIKEKNILIKQLTEQLAAHQEKSADVAVNLSFIDNTEKAESECKMERTTTNDTNVEAVKIEPDNRKVRRLSRAPKAQKVNSSAVATCSVATMHQDKRRRRSSRLSMKTEEEIEATVKIEEVKEEEKEEEKQVQMSVKIEEVKQGQATVKIEEKDFEEREKKGRESMRPLRRAAEKVVSYKETPLNVKMRRLN